MFEPACQPRETELAERQDPTHIGGLEYGKVGVLRRHVFEPACQHCETELAGRQDPTHIGGLEHGKVGVLRRHGSHGQVAGGSDV